MEEGQINFIQSQILSFDYLCSLFTSFEEIKGLSVEEEKCLWGSVYIGLGRIQRDWLKQIDSIPRLRVLGPSVFLDLCIHSAHKASLGLTPELASLYFYGLRVACDHLATSLRKVADSCISCNHVDARVGRVDTRIKSLNEAPSGRLTTLSSLHGGYESLQIDLCGPVAFLDAATNTPLKLYFLVAISNIFGHIKVLPIRNKKTESIILGLKTLCLGHHTRIQFLASDSEAGLAPLFNHFSPMQDDDQYLSGQEWLDSFHREASQLQLAGMGIFLKMGTNRNATAVEKRIGQLKHLLRSFSFFTTDSQPTDLFKINYMCRVIEYSLMTRPLFACKGRIFSLQNINSLFLDQGRLQSAGFDGIESPGLMKRQVEAICSRLHCLRKELATLIVATHLPTLFDINEKRERVKRKKHLSTDLRPGDLIFDSVHYSSSSNLTGSLGKVVKLGTSTRHCLIEKCLPSHGKKEPTFATFAKNVVSRPTGELHFICSNDELQEGVSFGKALPIFDLCSEIQAENGPDYFCFNSDAQGKDDYVVKYVTESESDGFTNQRNDVDVEQTPVDQKSDDDQQPVKNDSDSESEKSESESPPPLRTRTGRAIKKPIKFGFDE